MEFKRDTIEFKERQKNIIEKLVQEASCGETKRDVLTSTGRSLLCKEAEVMYFKAMRDFFETSISHMIMNKNQDIPKCKELKKTRILR